MSIGDALGYPFKDGNIAKLLPLAIVYSIIMYVTLFSSINGNIVFMCGGLFALLGFGFVLSGYYVSAIAAIQHGHQELPALDVSQNVGRGVASTLASIVYFLPLIVLLFVIFAIVGVGTSVADSGAGAGLLLICGAAIAMVIGALALSLGYSVGLCRYAAEDSPGALFDVINNTKLAWANGNEGGKLIGRSILIGILSAIISGIFSFFVNSAFPVSDPSWQPTTAFWLIYSLTQVVVYTVSLIFAMAYMYLIAHYGINLGIGGHKSKLKNDEHAF